MILLRGVPMHLACCRSANGCKQTSRYFSVELEAALPSSSQAHEGASQRSFSNFKECSWKVLRSVNILLWKVCGDRGAREMYILTIPSSRKCRREKSRKGAQKELQITDLKVVKGVGTVPCRLRGASQSSYLAQLSVLSCGST